MSNLSCKAAGKCAKHTGLRMMRQVERAKSMNPKSMNPKSMTRPNGKQGIKKEEADACGWHRLIYEKD